MDSDKSIKAAGELPGGGPADYGDWLAEYRAAREGVGLLERAERGWVEVRGHDRATWLHNLITNRVTALKPGEGGYAFATNAKGRVVFDLHYLVGADGLWLDIDRRWITAALGHLDHHLIADDVILTDRSEDVDRLGVCGAQVAGLLADLAAPHVAVMNLGQHACIAIAGVEVQAFRSDFAGPVGIELVVPARRRPAVWDALLSAGSAHGCTPVGRRAIQALRMERGVPWSLEDINDDVIPPETGRIVDGIDFTKGCYVGQEVIERMRSRGASARKLVGLRVGAGTVPAAGDTTHVGGTRMGRVTSACFSPALEAPLALAYLAAAHAKPGTPVEIGHEGRSLEARVIELPLR